MDKTTQKDHKIQLPLLKSREENKVLGAKSGIVHSPLLLLLSRFSRVCDSGCPGQTADGCLAGGSRPHRVAGVGGKGDLASGPDRLASRR